MQPDGVDVIFQTLNICSNKIYIKGIHHRFAKLLGLENQSLWVKLQHVSKTSSKGLIFFLMSQMTKGKVYDQPN